MHSNIDLYFILVKKLCYGYVILIASLNGIKYSLSYLFKVSFICRLPPIFLTESEFHNSLEMLLTLDAKIFIWTFRRQKAYVYL